ncbi:hypothetical protein PQX77_001104 [Marasmius sp. AFHP31]|nr:hypothetical protein PQX77_001104 [Marasmius sp. AFHP31]
MQFSSAVFSALASLCLFAISVAAAPGLSLSVSGSKKLAGVQDFKITTSLINTGNETLKLVKDPRTILSSLPTNCFTISNAEGASPVFTGARAKFVPEYVVENNIEEAFVVLKPGASHVVEHDLLNSYNFTAPGKGTYDIRASNLFHHIDPATNQIAEIRATHEKFLTASLTGTLSNARRHTSRATSQGCDPAQQKQIVSAAKAATSYASSALSYLNSHTSATTRYTSWFGVYSSSRHATVLNHFKAIYGYPFSGNVNYDCTCKRPGTFAYVYADQFGTIYLCNAFWTAPNTGNNSQAGTLIHESSHFTAIAGTEDYVYGPTKARNLAVNDPARAIFNADNHEYFAENIAGEA